jgi:plastocyanin
LLRKYRVHDFTQTPIVILNFFFIIFLMGASFSEQDVATTLIKRPTELYYIAPFIHAGLGVIAQGLATYCLLAGHKILPRKIGTLRYFMWTTYGFWILALSFGLATYAVWYLFDSGGVVEVSEVEFDQPEEGEPPAVQRALLQDFAFQPQELTVVAGTTVVWVNQDGAPHNVTFVDGSVASDNFRQGEAFEITFEEPGVYPIYCTLHGNPTSGMSGAVTVVEESEENIAQLEAQPTVQIVPPTPTAAPPVPLAPLALVEPPTPEEQVLGLLAFRDNVSPGDSVTLAMVGVEPAPSGSELHAWLIGSDGQLFDMGPIEPNAQGSLSFTHTDPGRQNLMALYDGVQITVEPAGDVDPSPGRVVYGGRQAPIAFEQIRLITAAAEDTPLKTGYGIGARLQAEELARHAQYIQLAYDLGSIADAQRHAEHIINILEREGGEFFKDWDGVHGLQNPGDGYGLIPYIEHMKAAALTASTAEDATSAVKAHAEHVRIASDNALETAQAVLEAALGIIEASSIADAGPQVDAVNRGSLRVLVGEDVDGDGIVSLSESGVFVAYQHAQYMGAVGVLAGDAAGIADPVTIGGQETQLAAGEVVIDMVDFAYSLETLTIQAGSQVRFVNRGQARHSATADDQSFDTGLLDPGQEMVVTFDEIGFFPYYCLLHGTRGGVGMAASITVVEAGTEIPPAEAEPTAPPAEDAPSPTEAPPDPAAPGAFNLDMIDFTYSVVNLEVPAGSTLTWTNAGNVRHSATADDGSWDTGLIGSGEQASITFDTPGAYAYYCTLHGAPEGIGMSAVVTVTD